MTRVPNNINARMAFDNNCMVQIFRKMNFTSPESRKHFINTYVLHIQPPPPPPFPQCVREQLIGETLNNGTSI